MAEFVQNRARAENRSVTNYVETLLLREKERVAETEGRLIVQAAGSSTAIVARRISFKVIGMAEHKGHR